MQVSGMKDTLQRLRPWLPLTAPLRLVDIGCGTAEEVGELLGWGCFSDLLGVDLDETAVDLARARWPRVAFLCADATDLLAAHRGAFDVVLIRRPDLFAQPESWQRVFSTLPELLQPGGRLVATFVGEREANTVRAWLEKSGVRVIHAEELPSLDETRLLVAEATAPRPRGLQFQMLDVPDDEEEEGMICDATTGECFLPVRKVEK